MAQLELQRLAHKYRGKNVMSKKDRGRANVALAGIFNMNMWMGRDGGRSFVDIANRNEIIRLVRQSYMCTL